MAANWGENTWGSSGWGGYTLLNSNAAAGAVGSLTASISVDIGISRFLLEDGSGYLLLEDGSYLMEEAGTGPIPSINGAVGSVAQSQASTLTGVSEISAVGSTTQSTTVASTGVSAAGNVNTTPEDNSELLTGIAASGGTGTVNHAKEVALTGVLETSAVGSNGVAVQVSITGVFATGNTSSVSPDKTVALSGVASLGNLGAVAPTIEVSINTGWGAGAWGSGAWGSSGPSITGAVGSNGVAVQVASTGNAADGQTGTIIYNRIEFITGLQGFGAIGGLTPSTTVTIGISRFLLEDDSGFLLLEDGSYLMEEAGTGPIPSINGAVGSVVQSYAYSLTGIEAAANVGAVVPSTTVSIVPGSWGLGAWGANVWGGVQAAITGSVGSVVYSPTLTGVQASGSVGQMTPSITVDIGISRFLLENTGWGADTWGSGAWGSSNIGYLLLEDGSYLMEEAGTGPIPSINGAVGDVNHTKEITLTSDLAIGAVNEMIAESPALRGVHADGFAGTPVSNVTVAITGVTAQGAAGYLAAVQAALLSGVAATGSVGVLGVVKSYWDIIDDAQDANWVEIANAQTATWTAISNAQTAGWAVIPNAQSPAWGGVADAQDAGWELIPTAFDQN
jgi:hypothetical protein